MNDPGLYEWLALRSVAGGGVAKSAGVYFDHGRPVPGHLIEVFDRLVWNGLLVVADGDPIWESRRISLTEAGQEGYGVLCQQQEEQRQRQCTKSEVPPPEFGSGRASAGEGPLPGG